MSLWPTVIGVAVGLAFALFANLVVLPYVLRKRSEQSITKLSSPFGQLDAATLTTFAYRVLFPIVFGVVFAIGANKLMEGTAP